MEFVDAQAGRLEDREYFDFALACVEAATARIWASLFIQDVRPSRDIAGNVLELTMSVVARRRAGVDVRVLLTGRSNTPDIAVANMASGLMLRAHGVPHRALLDFDGRRGSHAKFIVCDDVAVVGSQNWTDDGFRLNTEDAIILSGPPVEHLAGEFQRLWVGARRVRFDAGR